MIPVEAWTTIRTLHAQGKSVRRIAHDLNLSRNTVRHALRSTEPPRYQRQPSTHTRRMYRCSSASSTGVGENPNGAPRLKCSLL